MDPLFIDAAGWIWERVTREERYRREAERLRNERHPDAEDQASLDMETLARKPCCKKKDG